MKKNYSYDFGFPRNYSPEDHKKASDFFFCETTFKAYVNVIESCIYHIKGDLQGTPLKLAKWQKDIVAAVFCILHKKTKQRRYKECFIYIPRKNGKSLFCSALVLAYLILDKEKGKEIISVAAAQDQASLIYTPIVLSLGDKNSPLKGIDDANLRFKVYSNPKSIISENKLHIYKPITADGDTNHGLNVSFSVMDELHAWSQRSGKEVYEAVMTSGRARKSQLNIMITTADYAHSSICNDKFEYAKGVASGRIDDPRFLPVLFYLEDSEDWTNKENWFKVNPQLGDSITIEAYEEDYQKALNDPSWINSFKRLYLNIQTKTENKFLDFAIWSGLEDKSYDEKLLGKRCFGGLDLAFKDDLCAFVLEFPLPDDKKYVKSWFWIPEKHKNIRFFQDKGWIDDGFISVTEGSGIDFKTVKIDIIAICRQYDVIEIGYDPRFASEICSSLYNDEGFPMIEVPQYARILSEPLKDIAVAIVDQKIFHDGNNCASWQVGNASCKEVEGGLIRLIKPTGKDTSILKVDFVAALSMAHQRMMTNLDIDQKYNENLTRDLSKGYTFF